MTRKIDPITLSTTWHAFQSIAREMRHVIDRTAQSYLLAQLHDMAAGIWDAQGRTIAVPEGPTSMFLSQHFCVEYILEHFGHDLHPAPSRATERHGLMERYWIPWFTMERSWLPEIKSRVRPSSRRRRPPWLCRPLITVPLMAFTVISSN